MSKFINKEPPSPETIDLPAPKENSAGQVISTQNDQAHLSKESSAPFAAGQCRYLKPEGGRCKAKALVGSFYCYFHSPDLEEERQAARVKGGKERSRKASVLPADTPDMPLTCAADVARLLADTINQVRRGELDSHAANAVGALTGHLLKAQQQVQQEQIERRLLRVESILERKWMNPNFQLAQEPEMRSFEFVKAKPRGDA